MLKLRYIIEALNNYFGRHRRQHMAHRSERIESLTLISFILKHQNRFKEHIYSPQLIRHKNTYINSGR